MYRCTRNAVLTSSLLLAFASSSVCADDGVTTSWSTGLEYSVGTYGGDTDIEDLYLPIDFKLNFERISFSLTLPYLSVRGPAGTTVTGPGGEPVPGSGMTTTESGLGDVVAGLTVYDVWYSSDLGVALDLTGKVKFGTADRDKGLGTGEQDFTFRADMYKYLEQFTLLGSVGYKFRGDPDDVDLENGLIASVGGVFYASDTSSIGLIMDYRESAFIDTDAVSELSVFVTREFNDTWSFQVYGFTGFSDSSSDWGGGFLITAG